MDNLKKAVKDSARAIYKALPVLVGALLLIGIANVLIPKTWYTALFSRNAVLDSFIGSALGSILGGSPITSYVLGGELLKQGISLVAVTAFLVAWVTVGIIQLPAEAVLLGKRFAFTRNISAFLLTIVVAVVTAAITGVL